MTRLRKIRKAAGIKQKTLAAQVGVHATVVGKHDREGVKTVRVAKRYAEALGCSPLDILEVEGMSFCGRKRFLSDIAGMVERAEELGLLYELMKVWERTDEFQHLEILKRALEISPDQPTQPNPNTEDKP